MEDEPVADPDGEPAEDAGTDADPSPVTSEPAPPEPDSPEADAPELDPPESNPHEKRLRALAGRTAPYSGPIIGITRGWVSRDTRAHAFAARFLDFAVLTDEHLMLCSTGFFSRRPRRRVFLEPLKQLGVVARGPEPHRTLRVVGDFNSPILIELRSDPNSLAFARELLEQTRDDQQSLTSTSSEPPDEPPDES